MCLAPPICSLDAGFFDEGMTIKKLAKTQKQHLLTMLPRINLLEIVMHDITKSV